MTKKEMIKQIVDNHVEDIREWVIRDEASLRAWIKEVLRLREMTKEQLKGEFSLYMEEGQ